MFDQIKADKLYLIVIFIVACVYTYTMANQLNYQTLIADDDTWFESDTMRYFDNYTERWSDHYRTSVHPLLSLFINPPTTIISQFGLSAITSVKIVCSIYSAIFCVMFFSTVRLLSHNIFDSILLTSITVFTSSYMFFSTVPETYTLGSISLLITLYVCLLAQKKQATNIAFITSSAISMSITVTNWMAGILLVAIYKKAKESYEIFKTSLLIVVILSALQNFIYQSSKFFLYLHEEGNWVLMREAGTIFNKLHVFFLSAIAVPKTNFKENIYINNESILSIQLSTIDLEFSLLNLIFLMWGILLILGTVYCKKILDIRIFIFITLFILGQLFLHILYGSETFLYSLHWVPFLVILVGMNLFRPQHLIFRLLLILFACGLFANNYTKFVEASLFLN